MKYYIKLLTVPLLFLALFSSLFIIWEVAGLPATDELAGIVKVWFDKYGLPVVFLSSVIEGMFLIGGYFPGVFIIFLSVILTDSIPQAIEVVAVVTAGLLIAHIFNYTMGKYVWYKLLVKFRLKGAVKQARERLVKRGPIAILLSYWLPSIGALTDTAAGIIHMPFKKFIFYSFVSVIMWNAVAGTLVYSFKDIALSIAVPASGLKIVFVFIVISIWIAIVLITDFYKRRKPPETYNTNPDRDP
ncbi:VTT domain-containing protein [Patescibacteria group bacterium]|nr:VTT domain-containing protein [Patescibacteria group bacterium]